MKLSDRERRIMMAAGVGAGVGAIFRAPLAGALFAAEVLYRDPEFESDVIIPAGIASVIAYCVFCIVFGWGSLFDSPEFRFDNPLELGPYTVLALVLVGFGWFYVRCFQGVEQLFSHLSMPRHLKPALGGLVTGGIGFFFPYTLAFGYGYAQLAIDNAPTATIGFLMILAIGKILTTSFSIGSGGSGGVFGPSVVIGGALGGVVGQIFHAWFPEVVTHPGAFVVVGMAGFFTAVSNAPISTIIFVSEMTNSYYLLLPSLLVCSLAHLLSRKFTIFENQVRSKVDSPAHEGEFMVDILQSIRVKDLMHYLVEVDHVHEEMTFSEFKRFFSSTKQHYFPVMDAHHQMVGIFSSTDIRSVLFSPDVEDLIVMRDIATTGVIRTTPEEDLHAVLVKLTERNIDSLPVVDPDSPDHLIGMLNRRDVIHFYNSRIQRLKTGIGNRHVSA